MGTAQRILNYILDKVNINIRATCDDDGNYSLDINSYDNIAPLLSDSQRKQIIDELKLRRES